MLKFILKRDGDLCFACISRMCSLPRNRSSTLDRLVSTNSGVSEMYPVFGTNGVESTKCFPGAWTSETMKYFSSLFVFWHSAVQQTSSIEEWKGGCA
jgi:hypothetical protein